MYFAYKLSAGTFCSVIVRIHNSIRYCGENKGHSEKFYTLFSQNKKLKSGVQLLAYLINFFFPCQNQWKPSLSSLLQISREKKCEIKLVYFSLYTYYICRRIVVWMEYITFMYKLTEQFLGIAFC